jgi:nucleoside-diphosphate-sugar epimerase
VEAAGQAGVKRIVYASTIAVYGIPRLPRGQNVGEDHPYATTNLSHYMRSKIEAERVLLDRAATAGVEVAILRLGLVYGPEKGARVSRIGYPVGGRLIVKVGLNNITLPSVFVAHAVEALALAGTSPKAAGHVYNVVDDECFTQLGFVKAPRRMGGRAPHVLFFPYWAARTMGSLARSFEAKNGIARRVSGLMSRFHLDSCARGVRYDNSRLKADLGWKPAAPLEECLQATCAPVPAHEGKSVGA